MQEFNVDPGLSVHNQLAKALRGMCRQGHNATWIGLPDAVAERFIRESEELGLVPGVIPCE